MEDNPIVDFRNMNLPRMPPLPRLPRGGATVVLALLVVAVLGASTLYQVQPEEVGIVLRFGRYVGTTEPGLRAKLPFVDQVLKVPVQRQLKQEFGFRTIEAGVRTVYAPADRDLNGEKMMLTGDLNVAVVEWIVQYRVSDPFQYLFKVRNLEETFSCDERGGHARGGW